MPYLFGGLAGPLQALLAIGFAALAIAGIVLMRPATKRLKATGGPGMVPLELAGSTRKVEAILQQWGDSGRAAATQNLLADLPFLVGYGGLLALGASSLAEPMSDKTWPWVVTAGRAVAVAAVAAAVLDAVEDVALWRIVRRKGGVQPAAMIAKAASVVKWGLALSALAWLALVAWPILVTPDGI